MFLRYPLHLFLIVLCTALGSCASLPAGVPQHTEVLLVGSIHGLHRENTTYPYEALYEAVRRFRPDAVGVEIRQEDLGRDSEYLQSNYPHEMTALASEYGFRTFGFDWLGSELEERPVPKNYWREQSWLKKLEKERAGDPLFQSETISALQRQQLEIARSATAASINDGRYDEITLRYYEALERLFRGTRYQRLTDFYRDRNEAIAHNIARFIRTHRGRRIAIVTGVDHRGYVARYLRRTFGSSVTLAQ